MKKQIVIFLVLIVAFSGYSRLTIKPLPSMLAKKTIKKKVDKSIVAVFFEEDFAAGGYEYHYPEDSKTFIAEEAGKTGEVSLAMDLVANDYSGGAIVLWNTLYDLSKYYSRGALEFWIKGDNGNEICNVALADDENGDGFRSEVRVPITDYVDITTGWSHVSIPLADFGKRGYYWNEKKKIETPLAFDWDKVAEFSLTIEKGKNKKFKVFVDDIVVRKDIYPPAPEADEEYWDERKEIVSSPIAKNRPSVDIVKTINTGEIGPDAYCEVYGKKTAFTTQPTSNPENDSVLAIYLDNEDYSGFNLNFGAGNVNDVKALRENSGGISFWAKFSHGVEMVFLGLVDDNSDKKEVQTSVSLADFIKPDTTWQYYMIPLKEFSSEGAWWNDDIQSESPGRVDWTKIKSLSITTDKFGARIESGVPVTVYIDDISIIKKVPGYVDPDIYWNNFKSDAPDLTLFDFEKQSDHMWEPIAGEESELFFSIIDADDRDKRGYKTILMEYSLYDWVQFSYSFSANSSTPKIRDWTKYNAIKFDMFTEKDEEVITIQIDDSGKEGWVTNLNLKYGWNTYVIPLRKFKKYTYYQPADAVVNNNLDLKSVSALSFNPVRVGTMGEIKFDNVKLINIKN